VLAVICATPPAYADEWRHTAIVYGMGAALDGDTQIGEISVPVDRGPLRLSYFDLSTELEVRTTAPVTGEVTTRKAGTDAQWIDH
jgi:hypothetical protein